MDRKTSTLIINIFFAVLFVLGCQTTRKAQPQTESVRVYPNTTVTPETPAPPHSEATVAPESKSESQLSVATTPMPPPRRSVPKFGVILSGGGAKTWAHVSILKELQKYKFPIVSIAGVEWGAIVAASYAHQVSVNEVEWEMSKFKEMDEWNDFIKAAFAKTSTLDFKIPFVCPSLNLKNKTIYLLNRGQVDQFLPYCLPSPGLVKPFGSSVAHMSDVNLLVQHLRATGVNKVILINVVSSKNDQSLFKSVDSLENQLWAEHVASLKKNVQADDVIEIELNDFKIDDFDKRKDIMVKGSDLSYPIVRKLADKYKL